MCECNEVQLGNRRNILTACLALMLLASPIALPWANGQFSLTLTVLVQTQTEDPAKEAPPVEPTAPSADDGAKNPAPTTEPPKAPETPEVAAPQVTAGPEANPVAEVTAIAAPEASSAPAAAATPAATQDNAAQKSSTTSSTSSSNTSSIGEVTEPQKTGTEAAPTGERRLSVEPSNSLLPADRPSWIGSEPDFKSSTHRFVVASIPTVREDEVDVNLDASLVEALSGYAVEQLGDDRAGHLLASHLSSAFIRTNYVDDKTSYTAELSTTGGSMYQKWVMVEISPEQQELLKTWYQERIQRERIVPLAVAFVGLLGLVGITNIWFRRSASRNPQAPMMQVIQPAAKGGCCGKRGGWGYAVAIAVVIAIAAFSA